MSTNTEKETRESDAQQEYLIYLNQSPSPAFCLYDTIHSISAPNWVDKDTSICVCQDTQSIYVVGGVSKTTVSCLQLIDKKNWSSLPNIPEAKQNTGIIYVDNVLYVFGGWDYISDEYYNNSSCHCLKKGSDHWERLAPIIYAIQSPLVINHNTYIYVIGGRDIDGNSKTYVQRYNMAGNTWDQLKELPQPIAADNSGVVVFQGKVTVLSPTMCMMYNDEENDWSIKSYPEVGVAVNALVYHNQLVGCVRNCHVPLNNVQHFLKVYNIEQNAWEEKADIIHSMFDRRMAFVLNLKHILI